MAAPSQNFSKMKMGGWICKGKENGRRDWSNPFGSWEADGWTITVNRPKKAEAYTRVNSRNWRATKRLELKASVNSEWRDWERLKWGELVEDLYKK